MRVVSRSVGPDGLSFFDRSQGLFASRIAGRALVMFLTRSSSFCLVVFCGVIGIREEKKKRREKKRSGQAGLLVPKAATTVRGSLKAPPFRHLEREGGKCCGGMRSPRSLFTPRARHGHYSMNLPGSTFTYKARNKRSPW